MQKDTGERDHEGREEIQKKEGRKTTKGGRKCRREGEIRKNGEKVRRRNKGRREDTIKSYSDCLLITPGEDSWGGGGRSWLMAVRSCARVVVLIWLAAVWWCMVVVCVVWLNSMRWVNTMRGLWCVGGICGVGIAV